MEAWNRLRISEERWVEELKEIHQRTNMLIFIVHGQTRPE